MRLKPFVIIIAIIAIVLAVIISAPYTISFRALLDQLTNNSQILIVLVVAIILQFIGHGIRAVRHSVILNRVRPVKTYEVFKGQSIGYLFNFILPFRLGELVRAHYIARGVSISRSAVFATIVFERFVDVLVMILLTILLIALLAGTSGFATVINVLIFLVVSALVVGFILYAARTQQTWLLRSIHYVSAAFNNTVKNRIRFMSWSAIYILKNAINRRIAVPYTLLTLVMWFFYLISTFILAWVLLPGFSTLVHWLVTQAAYLGIAIPSGPAYLTTFQHIFTDISSISATYLHDNNITLLIWFLLVVPISIVGLVFLVMPQKKYHEQQSDMIMALKNKLYRDLDITADFAHFLDAYFRGSKINRILTTEELENNFKVIRTFRGGSSALTLLAWQDERMVVKKITLKQYQDKLKAQYEWLHKYAKYPEITDVVGESSSDEYYSIDIDYQEEYIPFFDTIHSSSVKESAQTLSNILKFMDNSVYKPTSKPLVNIRLAKKYIKTKAIEKVVDSSSLNALISQLTTYDTLIANGEEYDNFYQIIDKIMLNKDAMRDISTIEQSDIHGDLTVDNVIVNPKNNKFIILDPNNENFISDQVVDLGKMMQSIHSGYEFLVLLSDCSVEKNEISFKDSKSHRYEELYHTLVVSLKDRLSEERYKTLLFHEAMHYCRMLPYRCDLNRSTAPVFYAIAVRLFNEFYKQYEK